jgi:hypothetical protein
MAGMGGNEQVVTGNQIDALLGHQQRRLSAQQQHPFILRLVVKDELWLSAANDALDTQVSGLQQGVEDLASDGARQVREEVADAAHQGAIRETTKATGRPGSAPGDSDHPRRRAAVRRR